MGGGIRLLSRTQAVFSRLGGVNMGSLGMETSRTSFYPEKCKPYVTGRLKVYAPILNPKP